MLGIYGGTFNPVHYGHLRTAVEIKDRFKLQQMLLIPCNIPPHRQPPEVTADMRLQMLKLAVQDVTDLQVDRRELDRPGPSYMVDTLVELKTEYPQTSLLLVLGTDAFSGLESWRHWQSLFEYAHIVVMTRPGFQPGTLSAFLQQRICLQPQQLQAYAAGGLIFQEVTQLAISATQIREIIATGGNPQFLLPDAVLAFIRQHQLYRHVLSTG